MKAGKLLRQIERRLELQARRDLAFIRLAELGPDTPHPPYIERPKGPRALLRAMSAVRP